ncbi:hypothetical protein PENSPDRAFT_694751 [Peniophora sp. CONT]|nr:hypothetical protein PENSPDRAFT_694751 [Peniophora sp. CONT]
MDPTDLARGYIADAAVALGAAFNELLRAIPIGNHADRIYRDAYGRTPSEHFLLDLAEPAPELGTSGA